MLWHIQTTSNCYKMVWEGVAYGIVSGRSVALLVVNNIAARMKWICYCIQWLVHDRKLRQSPGPGTVLQHQLVHQRCQVLHLLVPWNENRQLQRTGRHLRMSSQLWPVSRRHWIAYDSDSYYSDAVWLNFITICAKEISISLTHIIKFNQTASE